MEPESVMTPSPVIPTIESAPPVPAEPPKKPKLKPLHILLGVAVVLVALALGIVLFGGERQATNDSQQAPTGEDPNALELATAGWPKFNQPSQFYEISLPPEWDLIKRSPRLSDSSIFNVKDSATLEIWATKTQLSLDEYLTQQSATHASTVKSNKVTQVKVGSHDGFEHQESWPALGLQAISTYAKISDMLYVFILSPAGEANALNNESIIRDYRTITSSFRITDPSQLGQDLKEYQSQKIENLAFTAFSLQYPQTWVLTEEKTEDGLEVSIYRNNYEITISQQAVGGAVCLFSDSPAFEGSSGDLRSKQFSELQTKGGTILRRYFNTNLGDKSTMFFCEKQADGPYFQTPLNIGGLVYYVPAKYDPDIVQEMDTIIRSITELDDL